MMFFRALVVGLVSALLFLHLHHLHEHMHESAAHHHAASHRVVTRWAPPVAATPRAPAGLRGTPLQRVMPRQDETRVVDIQRETFATALRAEAMHWHALLLPEVEGDDVRGIRLRGVTPDSVFRTLGFQEGDLLVRVDDQPLHMSGPQLLAGLTAMVADPDSGRSFVDIEGRRAGRTIRVVALLH